MPNIFSKKKTRDMSLERPESNPDQDLTGEERGGDFLTVGIIREVVNIKVEFNKRCFVKSTNINSRSKGHESHDHVPKRTIAVHSC